MEYGALDPTIEFRITDILLPSEDLNSFVRFLVSVRHLTALTLSLKAVRESREGPATETLLILLLHLAASAKESADRFRECDANGLFAVIERDGGAFQQLNANLMIARRESARQDGTSTYSALLKPLRNSVGFHIDRDAITAALGSLRRVRFTAAEVDAESNVVSIPLVTAVLLAALPEFPRKPEKIADMIDDILLVQRALRDLAHDYFLLLIRVSTLKGPPAGERMF